jgi:hypothetical protein
VLVILLLLADVSAPLPRSGWASSCEARLVKAAHEFTDSEVWFDDWWKFRVTPGRVEARLTAPIDICGVYEDFRVQVRRGAGGKIQKLHDDGDGSRFVEFRQRFQPVIDACLREEDEQHGGEERRPIAEHARPSRTTRATH